MSEVKNSKFLLSILASLPSLVFVFLGLVLQPCTNQPN